MVKRIHFQRLKLPALCLGAVFLSQAGQAALRHENFDREPANWEGINNRNTHFEPRTVVQDFGYSPATAHAGGQRGEVGGHIQPAGEMAYYGHRLPAPLNLDQPLTAEGKIYITAGSGHFLVGFFNTNSLNEWRTPNAMVARLNVRGDVFHCHLEYGTARWRAGAGVVGEIVPGERISAKELPCDKSYRWKMDYDPKGGSSGRGLLTFTLDSFTAQCEIPPEHRQDGIMVTHFGLLPVLKSWDNGSEVWMDDLTINGVAFDFSEDPKWEGANNRRTYITTNIRPKFDFGWSATWYAGGNIPGELGGLIFRGDCREPHRMGSYGDRIETLTLNNSLIARGKVVMLRGVTDSTASIGFYNSKSSMQPNSSQKQSIPMDYIGINIEGPSSEGFFFYPVYRVHGDSAKALGSNGGKAPRIYPDGKVHDWFLRYDPDGANGRGQITVGLDHQTCTSDLEPGDKAISASFDRFGICTPWIDGNSVTVYFDDLTYTCAP